MRILIRFCTNLSIVTLKVTPTLEPITTRRIIRMFQIVRIIKNAAHLSINNEIERIFQKRDVFLYIAVTNLRQDI